MDRADQIFQHYPYYRKTVKWTKKSVFFFLHMAALNSFMLKKHATNQKQKGKGYAVKDFILDSVQEMTEPHERKDGKNSAGDESLALTSTARTWPTYQQQLVKYPADNLQDGFKKCKMFHVLPSENKKVVASGRCRVCSAHKQRKGTCFMCSTCNVAPCTTVFQ